MKNQEPEDIWENPLLIAEAQKRTKLFIKKIYSLIKKDKFDVILAPGTSGIMMAKITELIYISLGMQLPKIIKYPIYLRKKNGTRVKYDNSGLILEIREQIIDVAKIENVLYVDDELTESDPRTLRTSVRLIRTAEKEKISKRLKVFVVAEGGNGLGHLKRVKSLKCKILYRPYSIHTKRWDYVRNFVSYEIPLTIRNKISKIYPENMFNFKEIFCVLLGEPIKDFKNGKPILSYKWNFILKNRIKNFEGLKLEFKKHINNLIREAIRN